jgi:hypothetical protein
MLLALAESSGEILRELFRRGHNVPKLDISDFGRRIR